MEPPKLTAASSKRAATYAVITLLCLAQIISFNGFNDYLDQTVPKATTLKRMIWSKLFYNPVERLLVRKNKDGICDWAPPEKLNSTYTPPHTILVSYPGSGKRLGWRIIESLTGFVTGDDWDLSEEGYHVASIKTSYPHHEGVWSWGDDFYDANIIFLVRNPRWAIPSYQTMRHELHYSNGWDESYVRRPNTYTERPDLAEWNNWRNRNFRPQLRRWGWMIDFYMNDGLRAIDSAGNPIIDYHCKPEREIMNTCIPKAIVSFERLSSSNALVGEVEAQKIATAMTDGRQETMPIAQQEDWRCAYDKVIERRISEDRWDNTGRDGHGPPGDRKMFRLDQLEDIKTELERLINTYTNVTLGWDLNPLAHDLVFILADYLTEVDQEIVELTPVEETAS